ncbi:hypothetical protein GNI_190840 [Gregarina niphandrodes]|uniref:Uncharacterized protein n=1 Tax=Gregarina niphandrodes TaxID=110365 RepID=A0A023AXP1_GRENI|nr:hypothetical protein GNI_190840 [Gregarina niphandrodes]EZG43065.1 hypothetical protein GNI_190840 [Gregarina niphandrodes]|eukprot:XP_011133663.1 hypothetical protein GNI_190840 [Gregarina niphandrodes]
MKVTEATIYVNGQAMIKARHGDVKVKRSGGQSVVRIETPCLLHTTSNLAVVAVSTIPCRVVNSRFVERHVTREALVELMSPDVKEIYNDLKQSLRKHALTASRIRSLENKKNVLEKLCSNMVDPRTLSCTMRPGFGGPGFAGPGCGGPGFGGQVGMRGPWPFRGGLTADPSGFKPWHNHGPGWQDGEPQGVEPQDGEPQGVEPQVGEGPTSELKNGEEGEYEECQCEEGECQEGGNAAETGVVVETGVEPAIL